MRTLLSWSTGKDSAWSLHVLRRRPDVTVVGLVTTLNAAFDRVAMHGVRRALLEAQAAAAGLPLHVLPIPHPCPNADYERIMGAFVAEQSAAGIEAMAFGDLFLEDIRRYREAKLAGSGIVPLFPLWGLETGRLAREMIAGGLEAYVTCVDPKKLPDPTDPENLEKVSGRGLLLMRTFMDEVSFNSTGNQVTMVKKCTAACAAGEAAS